MPMIQKNLYTPGQNLNNQAENIDLNRVADDKSFITVNFGTSPATVTIKVGSLIEVNGNQYAAETSDIVFQMSNASHNYITYNGTTYASSASIGTFDSLKAGYYTGTARTLKWYIDQTNGIYYQDNRIYNGRGSIGQRDYSYQGFGMSKFSAYRNAGVSISGGAYAPFNATIFDINSEFNTGSGLFTANAAGWYFFGYNIECVHTAAWGAGFYIRKNTAGIGGADYQLSYINNANDTRSFSGTTIIQLAPGDTVGIYMYNVLPPGSVTLSGGGAPYVSSFFGYQIV